MRTVIGILMVLGGVVLGLYVGVWLCFVGGLVDIIETIKAPEIDAMKVAIGAVKILFTGVAGGLSAILLIIPGQVMLTR